MNKYKVLVCIPNNKNNWQASIIERYVIADSFNELLEKAMTIQEHSKGARIVEIWEQKQEDHLYYERIV